MVNRQPGWTMAALVVLATGGALGCGGKKDVAPTIQTVAIERRDIVVEAEATGVVEPINVIEVKSKASGQITRMPVETGTAVRPGDLLVQVDTRDVRNQYDQTFADVRAAEAKLNISAAQKKRSDDLFAQQIITAQEHEAAQLDYANAQAQVIRARTNLDLAQQRLEDATVRAPVAGTVIEKTVSLGQVITSATGAFGGGTTLLKMADLNQVRVRALVNETDVGNVQPGQTATVTVDAYPDRPFRGTVEKIEPQAVVQQSVTMFPVLVSLSNREGLLKPGMNGEVSILVERREGVLAVPNDAIRNMREAAQAAQLLGLDAEQVRKDVQAQMASMGGGMRGGAAGANGAAPGQQVIISRGELARPASAEEQGQQGGGRRQLPEVTGAQCETVSAAFAKHPNARARLDTIRERMVSGEGARTALRDESQKIYATLGVDAMVARACAIRARGGTPGGAPQSGGVRVRTGAAAELPARAGARTRTGLVFVSDSGKYAPRIVRLGIANYDYTEVVSGLQEGQQVALLSSAALQAQRQRMTDRFRGMTGGGVPGMQRQTTPPAGGAGGAATGGARPPGGGGGGRP